MHQLRERTVVILLLAALAAGCGRGGGNICRQRNTTPSATKNYSSAPDNGSGSSGDRDCKTLQ